MKVLVTGAGGQVGREIVKLNKLFKIQVIGLGHTKLDITDSVSISNVLNTHMPDFITDTKGNIQDNIYPCLGNDNCNIQSQYEITLNRLYCVYLLYSTL